MIIDWWVDETRRWLRWYNLNWKKNTDRIVKEANKRMFFLHKLSKFTNNKQDLKKIYILQIRSKLEQSCVLWHSSITQKCEENLERVQKSALRIILGVQYLNYENALRVLKLQSLKERRNALCLKFESWKKCSLETNKIMIWEKGGLSLSRWKELWLRDWGDQPSHICRDCWMRKMESKETSADKYLIINQWTMICL